MTLSDWIVSILLGAAVLLALFCSICLATMKDAYQRMQFSIPVTSFSIGLIALSVWLKEPEWQARIKVTLVGLVLFCMNSILTHATARAVRIRETGKLEA